jgi:hypothetical protein
MGYLGYTVSARIEFEIEIVCNMVKFRFPQRKSRPLQTGQCLRRRRKFTVSYSSATSMPDLFFISATLTDLLRKSQPQKVTLTHVCLEAFETLKLRLISAPCLILPEVGSDATFTVATDASTVRIALVMLQDQGGGLQPVSYWARKLNPVERGNTHYAYDLEALAVCEAVKHWRRYLEGCSKFLVVTDHDTLRHPLMQPNNMLTKRQARYMRDLQPFVGSMTLAYRKGAPNEADPLSRRPNFVPHATVPLLLGWRGSVKSRITTEVPATV